MSIRRRLFFSNILMLGIPVAVCVLIAYMILFTFTGRSERSMEQAFPKAYQIMTRFHMRGDVDALLESAEEFNAYFEEKSVFLAVAYNGSFIYPQDAEQLLSGHDTIMPALLEDGVTGNISMNNLRIVADQNGDYRILLVDTQYNIGISRVFDRPIAYQMILIFGMLITIVLVTNRILTHFLTRSITVPLGMLMNGVHQLQDGNLSYRIYYTKDDEFTTVCEDFNDMAEHLQRLIHRQQKDEHSRNELLAGISHDLRTPLTSIKAYVEGLLDGIAEDRDTQLRYLGTIRQKAEDIDSLVDKLFLFSKLEMDEYPFSFERIDVVERLKQILEAEADGYAKRGLRIVEGEMPESAYVYTDPVQLRSALINILENSALYKEKPEGAVRVDLVQEDGHVDLVMTDDGPGVSEEGLSKLFDVFYRGDPSRQSPGKGSGLGLAITSRVIGRMGGAIRAENAPEGGLRMILTLPTDGGERA